MSGAPASSPARSLAVWLALAVSSALLASLPARAADVTPPAWQIEAGVAADRLSSAAPDWRQVDLALRHRYAPRSLVEFNLRRTQRSGRADTELGGVLALPLGAAWQASLGVTLSPSHEALPRQSARLELSRSLAGGWVASAALARRRFEVGNIDSGTSQLTVGLERYVDAWRFAAAFGSTRLDGGGSAGNLRLQIDRSFAAERGRIGLIVARGRELEGAPATLLAPNDVVDQRVETLALVGILPLADRWALTGEASHVRNGDLRRRSVLPAGAPYQRSGARVGVRRDF